MTEERDVPQDDPELFDETDIIEEYDLENDMGEPLSDGEDAGPHEDDHDEGDEMPEVADRFEALQEDARMVLRHHDKPVDSCCFGILPDLGAVVISGGEDDKAVICRASDGSVVHTLKGHTDSVISTKLSHDLKYLATGALDATVKLWDPVSGSLLHTLEGPSESVEWIEWHPRGSVLLAGGGDGTMWMWNATSECLQVFAGHGGAVNCGGFSPDGKMVVSGSEDGTVRVWDPKTGATTRQFGPDNFHTGPVVSLAIHPASVMALSGDMVDTDSGDQATARLLNLQHGTVSAIFPVGGASVESLAFCTSGLPLCATGNVDGEIASWDLNTLQRRQVFTGHTEAVVKLLWHPTQPYVYSASNDGTVRLWDGRTGQCGRVLHGHTNGILDMVFVPESNAILTSADDHTVRVFQL